MAKINIPLHATRSVLTIQALRSATGLGPIRLQKAIRQTYSEILKVDPPHEDTTREYFRFRRPIPYDPPATGGASYLLAMELTFPGTSRMFFHPFFNLVAGPLPSSEQVVAGNMLYPESWITELLDEAGVKARLAELAETQGDSTAAKKYLAEARTRIEEAETHQKANDKVKGRRQRKKPWSPSNALDWIHVIMLHLGEHARKILFSRDGLATTWGRRYDPIARELKALNVLSPLDALTAELALLFEASYIGDGRRFATAYESVSARIDEIRSIPFFKPVAKELARIVHFHLRRSYTRRYDLLGTATMQYPQSWKPIIYECWTEDLYGIGFELDNDA
jgi:hypothetical protein